MCGRLVISEPDLSVFVEPFHVQNVEVREWQPHFNIAPTQLAPLITNEPERRMTLARFGLIPLWAKDPKIANRLINARVEGLARSKVWKPAVEARRGIVPASGYFEWRATAQGKRPVFIHDARGQALALAALWDQWRSPDGDVVDSFAVLTRPAVGFLTDIHTRMPFALRPEDVETWLNPEDQPLRAFDDVFSAAADVAHYVGRPVSALANSPRNDVPECIAPATEPEPSVIAPVQRQLELFESIAATPRAARSRRSR